MRIMFYLYLEGKNVFQCFWSDPKTRVFECFSEVLYCFCHLGLRPISHYSPNPPIDTTLPFNSPVIPIPSHFVFAHNPFHLLDIYVLLPDGTLPDSLYYCILPPWDS